MSEKGSFPKSYSMDVELKSQIAYESLCENYGKKFIDDLLGYIKMDKITLADDLEVRRILELLNKVE